MPNGSYRPDINRHLDIGGLIGAPLVAAARANSMMAREQMQLLIDFCFHRDGDVYHPVMIQMTITRAVLEPEHGSPPTIRHVRATFSLPLLTVMPISSLAVEEVTLDFDLEITTQSERELPRGKGLAARDPEAPGSETRLKGRVSYDSEERARRPRTAPPRRENNAKLDVNVKAGTLPLPLGLTTILNVYTKSIHPLLDTEDESAAGSPPNPLWTTLE